MSGSTFGNILKITTWGESHGAAVGAVIDGIPSGLSLCEEDIQKFLDRRKPGQSKFTTGRAEDDKCEILSGVFEGKTTGTPISIMVRNKDHHSADYSNIAESYRPGHADFTYDAKYGFRDYRGGGRSSGRETIGRVMGGAIAVRLLESLGVKFVTYTKAIGPVSIEDIYNEEALDTINSNPLFMPDKAKADEATKYLESIIADGDSAGGIIECVISNVPAGLGDPVFDKLSANLAKAICSIGAVKAFEIGDGTKAATLKGSENNDLFGKGGVLRTNHSGGILGGISTGAPIVLRAHIKPTPSISSPQKNINNKGEEIELTIKGRHDPVIVPRAVVVVESMAAIAIADALLAGATSRMDNIFKIFKN
ncbi:MAG: chorismate synthase [Lachnospiraceae bacterium]|nr:chorismate synthase [Lachnospiraceae bacterium]